MTRKYTSVILLTVAAIGALGYFYSGGQTPPGQAPLEKLNGQNLADIGNAFNAAKDDVRILLLLSPT